MSADRKFLGVALLLFTALTLFRVAPEAAITLIVTMLAVAYRLCGGSSRR